MSDKIYKSGNIKNREFLADKNSLPLADKLNEETVAKTIEEKNDLLKDSVIESVTEQDKNKTTRIPIKGENTTEYFKNHQLPKPEPLPKPEVQTSKLNQIISKIDDLVEKAVPYIDNAIEKTAPYIDDVAKGLETVAKVGGVASGVIGFLNPESTATDAQMEEVEQRSKQENQQKVEEPNKSEIPPRLENIQNIENLSAAEKENIISLFKDFTETEQPSYLEGIEKIKKQRPYIRKIDIDPDFDDDSDNDGDGND